MKIALISDIHGNTSALDAVLEDIQTENVDQIVCLGDVAAIGPQPGKALTSLKELNIPSVMGNTDEWLLDPKPWETRDERTQMLLEIELWTATQLSPEDKAFIRTFQPTIDIPLGEGKTLRCYHGSPRSNTEAIFPSTPQEELADLLGEVQPGLMAGGHTHTVMLRRISQTLIINPGSVGLPFASKGGKDYNPAYAEYAIVEQRNECAQVTFRQVPIDTEAIRQHAFDSNMPYAEYYASEWEV